VAYSYNLKRPVRNAVAGARIGAGPRPQSWWSASFAKSRQGRTILTEFESKQLLKPTAFPRPRPASPRRGGSRRGRRQRSAIPVVLKLYSETITHKTDVGGVQLNLRAQP
jgi:acetyltransferase